MCAQLEHLGNYAVFIFNNNQQKPYFSPENPDILVNESTIYYLGRRSLPVKNVFPPDFFEISTQCYIFTNIQWPTIKYNKINSVALKSIIQHHM